MAAADQWIPVHPAQAAGDGWVPVRPSPASLTVQSDDGWVPVQRPSGLSNAAPSFDTALSPAEEQQFQTWKRRFAPNDSGEDYDLRGAFKAGVTPDPKTNHWPDTFKKPNEPTFSNESQYARIPYKAAATAGHWEGPNHDVYVPAAKAPTNDRAPSRAPAPSGNPISRVLGAAGSGFAEGWQPDVPLGLSPDTAEWFQNAGLLGHKGSANPFTAITGPVIQGVATVGDIAGRAFGGATAAGGRAVAQTGKELGMEPYSAERLGRDIQGMGEVAGIVSGASPYARIPRPAEIARRPYPQPGSAARAPGSAEAPFVVDREGVASKPVMDWAPVEPRPAQAGEPAGANTFKTAKGSTYVVQPDGRTVRDKAARPEHPGDSGPQPPSQRTFYVDAGGLDKLGFFQAQGASGSRVVAVDDASGAAAVRYTSGPDAGKVERRTVTPIYTQPARGLYPVELWEDGRRVHFGNEITEVATQAGGGGDWVPVQPAQTMAARNPKPIKQGPLEAIPEYLVEQAQYDVKQSRAALPNEPSLFTRIRQLGGMRLHDDAGNLTKEGQDVSRVLTDVQQPGLISRNGMRPDQVLSVLREEGYFGPRGDRGVDLQELYDMLDSEARGQKVYHPDSGMAETLAARADLQREFSEAGILPHDDPATAAKKLAEYRQMVLGGDVEERAAIMAEGSGAPISGPRAGESNLKPNINLAGVPKDDAAILEETARRSGNFADARRGVQSQEATQALADDLGMTSEQLMKRRRGQAFNAEESLAARNLLAKTTADIKALRDKIRSGNGSDADRALFLNALAEHGRIQEHVSAISAEAGRALQIHRLPLGSALEGKAIKEAIAQAGGVDKVDDLAEKLAALDDPAQLAAFVRNSKKATTWDMVMEAWKSALLSGPVTHAVNSISNAINIFMPIAETTVAAGLGVARRVTGGLPQERVYFREVMPQLYGVVQGTQDGLKIAAHTFAHEIPKDMELATEVRKPQALPSLTLRPGAQKLRIGNVPIPFTGEVQLGGKQIRTPLRALAAADDYFKEVARRQAINRMAMRQGVSGGLKGDALASRVHELQTSPTEDMITAADKAAHYQTFTNDLGPTGKAFQDFLRRYPGWQVVFPFVRTPVNIVKYAAERTPAAFALRDMRADLLGKNGTAAADTARAKVLLGSSLGATVAYYAAQGQITGQGPATPEERAALYATGWQPYSVKVGDRYVSYQRMAPLGIIMGATADMVEARERASEGQLDDIATLISGSITKNITNQTFLRGASDLLGALQNPDREGERWIQNLAGSVVPTAVAQYANYEDPYLREVSGIMDSIKRRIPGQSQQLPAVLDFFGQPIKREGAFGPDLVSPFYQTQQKNDPAASEIVRLRIKPTKVDRALNGVQLSPQQHFEYQAAAGTLAHFLIGNVIQRREYQAAPDGVKAEIIERLFANTKAAAREHLRARYPDLVRQAARGRVSELLQPRGPQASPSLTFTRPTQAAGPQTRSEALARALSNSPTYLPPVGAQGEAQRRRALADALLGAPR